MHMYALENIKLGTRLKYAQIIFVVRIMFFFPLICQYSTRSVTSAANTQAIFYRQLR